MPKTKSDLFHTLILTILAGLAVFLIAMSNRNVYSKELVDTKFEAVHKEIDYMQDDLRWIVRKMGGTPSVETEEDHHTSQSN